MILINKEVGETPLELLNRLKANSQELKASKLSYAGRLDPMAEGQVLVLVGDEENKNRHKYLGLDKEYEAEFLVGISTDSGDILGVIINKGLGPCLRRGDDQRSSVIPAQAGNQAFQKQIKNLLNIKEQRYPWFSSKTVNGKPLWEYYREGKTDIERPTRKVEIKSVQFLDISIQKKEDIQKYIFDSIGKVKGDFRQKEILENWRVAFSAAPPELQTFKIKILVSSGTYIRALCEEFDFPVCLFKLKRTKIVL